MRSLVLVLLAACSSHAASTTADSAPGGDDGNAGTGSAGSAIQTTLGPITGIPDGDAIAYEGIPYAAPPIGDLRWRPPQPAPPWTATRAMTAFGSACVQIDLASGGSAGAGGSEDCLTLNVWTPRTPSSAPLPVLVFIHGGYFVQGEASLVWHGETVYDGAYLAATGPAIAVTIQYRLGALGFLDDARLATGGDASANFGLLDQIAALQWVRANAAAFGGDPSRVAIFGQSAGGSSVCALLAAPLAAGLFSAAMIQSGGGCLAESATDAQAQTAAFTAAVGCGSASDVAACERALPAEQVATALTGAVTGANHWRPAVDGKALTAQPIDLLTAGAFAQVPVIVGDVLDEMSGQIQYYVSPEPSTEAAYDADVLAYFGSAQASEIEAEYPPSAYGGSAAETLREVMADALYICPARRIARALIAKTPTYRYIFEHAFDATDFPGAGSNAACSDADLAPCGAYHFIDVPYFFHTTSPTDFAFGSDEQVLAQRAAQYLVDFAGSGDPNGSDVPAWPLYEGSDDLHLALDTTIAPYTNFRSIECDFWDGL